MKRGVLVLVLCNAGRPLVAAANVDGELEVFARSIGQRRTLRLTLSFSLQLSNTQLLRAVMARSGSYRCVYARLSQRGLIGSRQRALDLRVVPTHVAVMQNLPRRSPENDYFGFRITTPGEEF